MRVALDISPTITGHSQRGIGVYTQRLKEEFQNNKWPTEFEFFENPTSPPPADVIHHPYFDLFFHTLPFKKPASRVVTIHDVIPLVFPNYFPVGLKGYLNLYFQKRALKNVDAVICDSQTSKEDIVSKLLFPKDKIHVVYLAPAQNFRPIPDKKYLSSFAKKYSLPKEFVLYVGDVNWNKNVPNLLEAVKIAKVNLVMVGKALADNSLAPTRDITKRIKRLGLKKQIIRTGYIPEEDLIALYNLAGLTILPSFYEGFGLPVLESMACGTLVVCSKIASLPEIAGNLAVFCDPEDPKDIAKKIAQVLNLPEKEKELLSQKLKNHTSKFTWHKVAKDTIKVYQQVFNKS
jgi:glycosyltransferase involved in cell wall biosynthesis